MIIVAGLSPIIAQGIAPAVEKTEVWIIDKEGDKLEKFIEGVKHKENVNLVVGSPSDLESWREVKLTRAELVLIHRNFRATLDVVQILRNIFSYAGSIACILEEDTEREKLLHEMEVEVIKPHLLVSGLVDNFLEGRGVYKKLPGVGLGRGELVEVKITEFSPIAGMKLGELRQRGLRFALLYRGQEVLLPDKDLVLQTGDRLLIAGKPESVELFLHTYLMGDRKFPLQWGDRVLLCAREGKELNYVKTLLGTGNFESSDCRDLENIDGSYGAVIFDKKREGIFGRDYLNVSFSHLKVPSIFLQGSFPFKRVVVSLNTDAVSKLLIGSLSLLRYLKDARIEFLYVARLSESRDNEEERKINLLRSSVERIKKVFSLNLDFTLLEGNPVRESRKVIEEVDLLLLGYTLGKKGSLFSPYTPYILAKRSPVTTILIPEVPGES